MMMNTLKLRMRNVSMGFVVLASYQSQSQVAGGVRNYFVEAVRSITTIGTFQYKVKWNKDQTKIRVIIVNFEESDKQSVFEKLNKMMSEEAYFKYEIKNEESFNSIVSSLRFSGDMARRINKLTPEKMKLLAWNHKVCPPVNCTVSTGLKTCSRCNKAKYCSVECQKAHWALLKMKNCVYLHK
jgi:hypothetical protein